MMGIANEILDDITINYERQTRLLEEKDDVHA
jgi:hypothetical protein